MKFTVESDSYHFKKGIALRLTDSGEVRRETWRVRVRDFARGLLWWRQTRAVVVRVDHALGEIETRALRWSWRRWRWL